MPEFAGHGTCLKAFPPFQSRRSTSAPSFTSDYCPSAILQAGAALAVQLADASKTLVEQDRFRNTGSVLRQDERADQGTERGAAGAGPENAETLTTHAGFRSVEPSLTGSDNHVPNLNGRAAPSLSKLDHLALTGSHADDGIETDKDTGMREPGMDLVCHTQRSVSPPPKRRRFADTMATRREPVEIHPLLSSAELASTVKLFSLLTPQVESVSQLVAGIPNKEEPFSFSKTTADRIDSWSTTVLCLVPERPPLDFFRLPGEIRNLIYSISLHWPTRKQLYGAWYAKFLEHRRWEWDHPDEPLRPPPPYTPRFRTPTILLLCKRITSECIGILRSRTLVIDRLPPWREGDPGPMPITHFIPKTTFQAVRRLELKIPLGLSAHGSGYVWAPIICDLLAMLREKNCFELLRVVFVIHYSPGSGAWRTSEQRHLEQIDHALAKLERANRNLKWPCTLERVYWIIEGRRASLAQTNELGELHPSGEEVRPYPDNEIYPSSIFEAA